MTPGGRTVRTRRRTPFAHPARHPLLDAIGHAAASSWIFIRSVRADLPTIASAAADHAGPPGRRTGARPQVNRAGGLTCATSLGTITARLVSASARLLTLHAERRVDQSQAKR